MKEYDSSLHGFFVYDIMNSKGGRSFMDKRENLESLRTIILAVIYRLAVGDALGVPVEFEERDTYCLTDMIG